MMNAMEQRLATLQSEYEAGQKMLAELDAKRASLTNTLLRIEGAMHVIRELMGAPPDASASPAPPKAEV